MSEAIGKELNGCERSRLSRWTNGHEYPIYRGIMRRHLITLFALFTGLAALHAPANASALESLVMDARAFARANDASSAEICACEAQARQTAAKCPARERARTPSRLLSALRPPFTFGSERALE